MDISFIVENLERNAQKFAYEFSNLNEEELRWRPAADKWCLLEVLSHLYDEEQFDFRVRIDYTLLREGEAWPAIDPQGWVEKHHYMQNSASEVLQNFLLERRKSIEWLQNLGKMEWQKGYTHSQIGVLTAGDLLASWLAHDYLHLRQIANLKLEYLRKISAPYSLRYAG
ncbi:DinB family protein [candidate division KSB1 bacterium]|nr:DinB family protein [candidate division KSB1 bacterium]